MLFATLAAMICALPTSDWNEITWQFKEAPKYVVESHDAWWLNGIYA